MITVKTKQATFVPFDVEFNVKDERAAFALSNMFRIIGGDSRYTTEIKNLCMETYRLIEKERKRNRGVY
jgi:hypothetical protein